MKILRYNLLSTNASSRYVARMPKGARVLSAEAVGGSLVKVWAAVTPDNEPEDREFVMLMTGEEFDVSILHSHRFLDTIVLDMGFESVVHVFEKK